MKSQDEFYLGLHMQLVRCDPLKLSSVKALNRDLLTLRSRTSHEGLAFLTKSLPKLGRALDSGLVSFRFNLPSGFASVRKTSIPAFMQGYFNLVFNEDGILRDVVPPEAIKHLRQVLYFAYKLDIPYSESENSRVIEKFIKTDQELELLDDPLALAIQQVAKVITRKIFHGFNPKEIHPQHGPGAVATGESLEGKWHFARYPSRFYGIFPLARYFMVGGYRTDEDFRFEDDQTQFRSPDFGPGQSKVVLVPKDSRGPRLISCEPLENQWLQQGLGRKLGNFLESHFRDTKGHINFTHQDINRNIAQSSSATQFFATMDLSDASDRVSLELVRRIFKDSPDLLQVLETLRVGETKLPDGRVITLKKYATMGSALCFPVEAYVFWVLLVSSLSIHCKMPLESVEKLVYVYGDDIIVPTEYYEQCTQALELNGLVVNRSKSCASGYFRESCGMEAFQGFDVTPLRLSKPWTNRKTDGTAYTSYISLANKLSQIGYNDASQFVWENLERVHWKIPYGTALSSFPCKEVVSSIQAIVLNKRLFRRRTNSDYQRVEFYVPRLSSRKVKSKLDGWPRLLRNLVSPAIEDPSVVVVPRSIRIKRGWEPVN